VPVGENYPATFVVSTDDSGKRLDQFLTGQIKDTSRARVQHLISEGKVLVNDVAAKASHRLQAGEQIAITGAVALPLAQSQRGPERRQPEQGVSSKLVPSCPSLKA